MSGRRPKPSALRALGGNAGHRPMNKREPKPPSDDLSCPIALTGDAQLEWARLVPLLKTMRVLTDADTTALAAYCMCFGRWIDSERRVRMEGEILVTDKGYRYVNPLIGVGNRALDSMRKFLIEFGLTPSSRSKVVALPEPTERDAFWSAFFKGDDDEEQVVEQ